MNYLIGLTVLVFSIVLIIAGVNGNALGLWQTIVGSKAPQNGYKPMGATGTQPDGTPDAYGKSNGPGGNSPGAGWQSPALGSLFGKASSTAPTLAHPANGLVSV